MWFDELYRTIQNNDSTVIELQFKSDDDDDLQWVGGMFLMTEDNYTRFDVEMPFLGPIIRPLHEVYLQPKNNRLLCIIWSKSITKPMLRV